MGFELSGVWFCEWGILEAGRRGAGSSVSGPVGLSQGLGSQVQFPGISSGQTSPSAEPGTWPELLSWEGGLCPRRPHRGGGGKAAAHPEARPVLCRLLEQLRLQPPCLMVQSQQDTPAWAASLMTPKAVYGVIVGLIGGGRPHCSPATWGLASLCDQEILLLWFF